jgi:cell division protein FtsW
MSAILDKVTGLGASLYTPTPQRSRIDHGLMWAIGLLFCLSIVMVYSASVATTAGGTAIAGKMAQYLIRQSAYLFVGLCAAFMVFQVSTERYQRLAMPLFAVALILLVGVLFTREINGSKRWINLGFFNFQPSELMKLAVVLYAADYTVRKAALMHSLKKGFLPMLAVMSTVGVLLLLEPDFGALVVVTSIAMTILFLGGLNMRIYLALAAVLPVVFSILVLSSPYRKARLMAFLDPWADPDGSGYQLAQSLIAIGRGEFFGVGLGAGIAKLYLPEAHTDFIVAVIGEELGLLGLLFVIGLVATIVYKAFSIGRLATSMERYFQALVAYGLGSWIGYQAFINLGVNLGLLPTKGLTMPFLSFGGSSMLIICVSMAVLLRIDYENRAMLRGASNRGTAQSAGSYSSVRS